VQPGLEHLHEGQIISGEVTGQHLLHGAVIDIGNFYHGLIPIVEDQWPQVVNELEIGSSITVRVHKVSYSLARFA
jgi:ribosomal protein S1